MTAYRAGQRVRIEWPNGDFMEGVVADEFNTLCVRGKHLDITGDGRTITVLSEPRPDEPTGLGAVVQARVADWEPRWWIRSFSGNWGTDLPVTAVSWADLIDPVVLHEGWTP